jgi:eukaryotic-like serine/threonine-protein kinase
MTDPDTKAVPVSDGYRVGDVIAGKYRLDAMLGEGGQAFVWRARNLSLEADVALKLLHPDTGDREPAHRLLREARAAARLGHPAIVRVFDLGETAAGEPFLVMELLSGEDLASLLTIRRSLLPTDAVRTLLPIADALVTAHAQGIIHRDLKPANVYLARSGDQVQPKLLDFGIVKFRVPTSRPEAITNEGVVIGSLAYLSPEQARGLSDIDERADIWCFCAMLYECLTGDTPFQGTSYNQLIRNILDEEPQSILERGVGDERLWEIVRRGLAKSTDERWQSMQELGSALAGWLSEHGVVDDIAGVSLSSRWLRHLDPTHSANSLTVASRVQDELSTYPPPNAQPFTPPASLGGTTEASFASRPKLRVTSATRRWYALGGTALFVMLLGIAVDRVLAAGSDVSPAPPGPALATETLAAGIGPLPKANTGARADEPRVVPANTASITPPPASASASAAEGTAKERTSPSTGISPPPAAAVTPPVKPRTPVIPAPPSTQTDLLNPY